MPRQQHQQESSNYAHIILYIPVIARLLQPHQRYINGILWCSSEAKGNWEGLLQPHQRYINSILILWCSSEAKGNWDGSDRKCIPHKISGSLSTCSRSLRVPPFMQCCLPACEPVNLTGLARWEL